MSSASAADDGPFYAGQLAHARGETHGTCPYPEDALTVRAEWSLGWKEAERYAQLALLEALPDGEGN